MLIHPRPGRTSSIGSTGTIGTTSSSPHRRPLTTAKVTEMQRRILTPKAAL